MEDNMEKVLLHTPEGVRDVYGKECAVKLTIENSINKVFNIYGYHNILLLQKIYISSLTGKVIL